MVRSIKPNDGSSLPYEEGRYPFALAEVDGSIASRFESIVAQVPDHPAVLTHNMAPSYRVLNGEANRIANAILATGSQQDKPVALYLGHDDSAVISIVGVLKAGRPYVSLDTKFPEERLREILDDSQASLLLTSAFFQEKVKAFAPDRMQVLDIASIGSSIDTNPSLDIRPDAPSALFYTSGTTGKSKAVVQTQRSFLHRAWTQITGNGIGFEDRIAHLFRNGYSASIPNFYGALLGGGTLCPLDLREEGFQAFTQWMHETEITLLSIPVTFLREWLKTLGEGECFPSVRMIALGGQTIFSDDLINLRPHFDGQTNVQIKWASTEANVYAEFHARLEDDLPPGIVPTGNPTPGRIIKILDDAGSPQPVGKVGEIAVVSRYLTAGYWRDPGLTQQRFREDPESGKRLCLTGDLGRICADGSLEFLGRSDTLVKIRGHRVQIEDVEIALLRQEGVLQTAIKDQPGADGEVLLLAYVVLREGASTTTEELMSGLRVILPEYMLPARIILVQSLPQSSSGKVDKSALTELQPHLYQREYEPPQNDLETRLAAMWETILDIQPIGRNADFFSLGGTSLAAMRLFAWIERDFGTMLPMTVLFGSPTIADLADQLKLGDDGTRWSPLVAVQSNGDLPPFFCVSPLVVDVLAYRGLALEMGSDQPFYALYAHRYERPGQEHMRGTIERLADQYVQEIRNLQQQGPYYIGGYSFGGRVAYEMARQLHADGERVALLALLETFAPGYLRDIPYLPKKLNRRIRNLPRIGDSFTNVGPWARMHFQILRDLDMRGKEAYLRVKLAARMREMRRRILKTVPRRQEATNLDAGVAIPDPNLPEYEPGTYEGKVAIFRAARQMIGVRRDPTMGWGSRISGDIEVHTVPGFHDSILFGPRLLHLAELLNESLAAARVAAAND